MASNLDPSSQLALRASISVFTGGKWEVSAEDALAHVRASYPIMGRIVERTDISRALRKSKFVRDHDAGRDAWKHQDRDHPHWGKAATAARALQKEEAR